MKTRLGCIVVAISLACMSLPGAASAASVTYYFAGEWDYVSPATPNMPALGNGFSGSFTYENTTPLTVCYPTGVCNYNSTGNLTLSTNSGLSTATTGNVENFVSVLPTVPYGYWQAFSVSNSTPIYTPGSTLAPDQTVMFINLYGMQTGLDPIFPSPLSSTVYFSWQFGANCFSAAFDCGSAEGHITSYSTSPVNYAPVPGPIVGAGLPGLLMAIAGYIGWRRSRPHAIAA